MTKKINKELEKKLEAFTKEWQTLAMQASIGLYSQLEDAEDIEKKIDLLISGMLAFGVMVRDKERGNN